MLFRSSHPSTLASVNNLAILLKAQGKYAEAEPLYRRAMAGCEKELGPQPCIASLSFGSGRDIRFRHRFRKELEVVKIHLEPGSLLLMEGDTQQNWQHEIPRRRGRNAPGGRINLTFRTIRYPRQGSSRFIR